jgi:hypothetical protein
MLGFPAEANKKKLALRLILKSRQKQKPNIARISHETMTLYCPSQTSGMHMLELSRRSQQNLCFHINPDLTPEPENNKQ